jgi:hypothetical protein
VGFAVGFALGRTVGVGDGLTDGLREIVGAGEGDGVASLILQMTRAVPEVAAQTFPSPETAVMVVSMLPTPSMLVYSQQSCSW